MKTSILIVEDDVIVAHNLRERLWGLGYAVCGIASSGTEAIEKTGETQPDLILMDIKLRGQMDGVSCAQEIHRHYDIPVIYLTGYADERTLQRAKLSEPYGYILKPFEVRDLHTTIEMALHKHAMEKRLRASEDKYRTLVEHSLQGIMIIQGVPPRVVFANDQCAEIVGYSTSELLELDPQDTIALVDPEDQGWLMTRLIDHLRGEPVPTTGTFRIVSRYGIIRWVEYYASLIEHGDEPCIQVAFIDITARRQAEEVLQRSHDELERRVEERTSELALANEQLRTEITTRLEIESALQQRLKELAALNTLGWQVSDSLSLNDVVDAALQGVVDSLASDLAMIFLLQEGGLHLQGLRPDHSAWKDAIPAVHRLGECLCGLALERGEPVYSTDIHADPRCTLVECKAVGMRSFVALPLRKGADTLGILGLASLSERDFGEQDAFLKALTSNVSVSLQNALLHQELQLHAAELERHVAQLRQAQEALRESEERYRFLFERNLAGVYRSTLDGRILACNEAMARILGYEGGEELLALPAADTYANPRDRERFIAQLQAQGMVTSQEWHLRRKDGSSVWCLENTSIVEGEDGAPVIQGTVFDITARKRMEEALQESEARYRTLFENAPLCIFEVDLAQSPHAILRTNRQTEAVYGWSPSEIPSITLPMIFSTDGMPDHQRLMDSLLAGEAITLESTHRRKDGTTFPVRLSAAPASTSEPKHIILAVEDISAEKSRRSEEEAIVEERRRMAREIHDGLAQNLASLRLRARLWHNVIEQDPERMHVEVDAMREFISEQIQEVRRSIFALRPVALDELGFYPALRQFLDDFGEQNQLKIELRILGAEDRLPPPLEPVLFRIVQEALNNVSRHARASMIWIDLDLGEGDSTVLVIRDDGQGFDVTTLARATRLGHLGLAQMRERVEELGGNFQVQSRARRGTEIRVTLPMAPQ